MIHIKPQMFPSTSCSTSGVACLPQSIQDHAKQQIAALSQTNDRLTNDLNVAHSALATTHKQLEEARQSMKNLLRLDADNKENLEKEEKVR